MYFGHSLLLGCVQDTHKNGFGVSVQLKHVRIELLAPLCAMLNRMSLHWFRNAPIFSRNPEIIRVLNIPSLMPWHLTHEQIEQWRQPDRREQHCGTRAPPSREPSGWGWRIRAGSFADGPAA
jgi:hypothetical protein